MYYKIEDIRILIQIVTGHANLKRHRYIMDNGHGG